ncbi:Tm-1-like ATP-binding domain-containing protein [Paludisphaera mucosa]|uniref:Tm-1-like ATP-binding domain-containing protein n=1 Tax=Paludisphaera mucosa TaxID=3030827 RepID=A0ABT6FF93_9BACT|nr:Tm-1-like ATP-binding domain-containing protein [Paludisphaera mucosa]MDG3006247.1 Tm-1-like ATP-binding domain-containing protein [Paludisphaera mucosa]
MQPAVYAIATMDTKGRELQFVAERLREAGVAVRTVDVGTQHEPQATPDLSLRKLFPPPHKAESGGPSSRADAVSAASKVLTGFLVAEHGLGRVAGVVGIGGSGGTALITPAMRALPIGLPKLMVSTVASGDVSAYVGCSDLVMTPSVVDVAGLNVVSRTVLANAAHAMAGMVREFRPVKVERPALGLTMFGLTTPCVDAARVALEALGYDPLAFHATGVGGRAMENLVASGMIQGVLDVTTTEVADYFMGGIFPCVEDRFEAQITAGVPCVLSLGALDMVNFGALDTVPEKYRGRRLHRHNDQITLMRTTPEENRRMGRWIGAKLNGWKTPVALLIPEHGLSGLDAPGQPFHDPEADAALLEAIEEVVVPTEDRAIQRCPRHINDPEFAQALVQAFLTLAGRVRD